MEILIGIITVVLLLIVIVQIGKVRELASIVRNDKNEQYEINKFHSSLGVVFMVVLLLATIGSFVYYTDYILGWGVNTAASEHGPSIDRMFNITLGLTGIVYFITQFLLFWFAWQYRGRRGHKAIYWSHNEKLEMVWMIVPAVAMTFLVVGGLQAWNDVMTDVQEGDDYMEIEATGFQFAWTVRYPGRDGKFGARDFKLITGTNKLGQDWTDADNIDDFESSTIYLPVNKKVRVRITSRDVLHNFYLPHFRVKMDAVPGMPTYFIFTPTVTTDSMRTRLSEDANWNVPDKKDPSKKRYETFDYVLACAELCGKRHYNMQMPVKIVTQEEYEAWYNNQEKNSTYLNNIRGDKNADPFASVASLDFEQILAEKDIINEKVKAIEDATKAAKKEKRKADYEALSATLTKIKEVQKKAITSLSVAEMKSLAQEATQIANGSVTPAAPVQEATTTDEVPGVEESIEQ